MRGITLQNIDDYVINLMILLIILGSNVIHSKPFQLQNDTIKMPIGKVISFEEVEESPVFSGCGEWKTSCELRNCFESSVINLLNKYIKNGFEKEQKYVVNPLISTIEFVVDTTGIVKEIHVSGSDSLMNKYSEQAISRLSKTPRIRPGRHQGDVVEVLYKIKILARSTNKKNTAFIIQKDLGEYQEKIVFDNYVIYPNCRETGKVKRDRDCLGNHVKFFINQNFNAKIAKDLDLFGTNTIYVRFAFSKCGNVINVRARGPHPKLEKEAIRVVKMLPKVKPAKIGREAVNVKYAIPIKFTVKS